MTSLNQNIQAALNFAQTQTSRIIWVERYNTELLIERTNDILKTFNYLAHNLVDKDKTAESIDYIGKLLSEDSVLLLRAEQGSKEQFKAVVEVLKNREILLKNDIKFEDVAKESIPSFHMDKMEYDNMFELAKESYQKSFFYQLRKSERGLEFAQEGLNTYLNITGEVLTQVFAKDYIKTFTEQKTTDIPDNYKLTVSGQNYIEHVTRKIIPNDTDKEVGFIQKLRNQFFKSSQENNDNKLNK